MLCTPTVFTSLIVRRLDPERLDLDLVPPTMKKKFSNLIVQSDLAPALFAQIKICGGIVHPKVYNVTTRRKSLSTQGGRLQFLLINMQTGITKTMHLI